MELRAAIGSSWLVGSSRICTAGCMADAVEVQELLLSAGERRAVFVIPGLDAKKLASRPRARMVGVSQPRLSARTPDMQTCP
jgi:hypothetical protein